MNTRLKVLWSAFWLTILALYLTTGCNPVAPEIVPCVAGEPCIVEIESGAITALDASDTIEVQNVFGLTDGPTFAVVVAENLSELSEIPGATALERDREIGLIEPIEVGSELSAAAISQWHHGVVGSEQAWSVTEGEGIIVDIGDTGVDCTHPDLRANCADGASFVGGTCRASENCDGHGHGTHVAGIVAANGEARGIAPKATIRAVRVLNSNGSGYISGIAQGIAWSANNGADVLNLSLGGPSDSPTLRQAIAAAVQAGVTVVVARGNAGNSRPQYPACSPGVVNVTATDQGDRRTSWSSYGSCGEALHVGAPGLNIASTRAGGGYITMSGTSMASPLVAGYMALLKALGVNPISVARQHVDPMPNRYQEVGRVAVGRAVTSIGAPAPTKTPGAGDPTKPPPVPVTPVPGEPTATPDPNVTPPPAPEVCKYELIYFGPADDSNDWGVQRRTVLVPCED